MICAAAPLACTGEPAAPGPAPPDTTPAAPLPPYAVSSDGFGGVIQITARGQKPGWFRMSAWAAFYKKPPPGMELALNPYELSPLGTCNGPTKEPNYDSALGGLGLNVGQWMKLISGSRKIGLAHDSRFGDPYSFWSVGQISFDQPSGDYDVILPGNEVEGLLAQTWPADVFVPRPPLLSNRVARETVELSDDDAALTWTPTGADEIWLSIFELTGDAIAATNPGAHCRLPDTGVFTIPPAVFASFTRGFEYFMEVTAFSSKAHPMKKNEVKLVGSTVVEYRFVRR